MMFFTRKAATSNVLLIVAMTMTLMTVVTGFISPLHQSVNSLYRYQSTTTKATTVSLRAGIFDFLQGNNDSNTNNNKLNDNSLAEDKKKISPKKKKAKSAFDKSQQSASSKTYIGYNVNQK